MLAYIFPGQGSQQKGMGSDLFDEFQELTQKADEILGYSIKQLCLEDPYEQLGITQFTQPALYCVSALSYLKNLRDKNIIPDFVAGHSLGEFVALFAAGAFDFETGLRLVKKRGELMGNISGGGMAAIVGLNEEIVKKILEEKELCGIDIANYNTPSQIVISGTKEDIEIAKLIFEDAGALKYVVLKVSGAFHSRYMESAKVEFKKYLDTATFNKLNIPVISNFYALPYENENIKTTLANQITGSVKWTHSIRYLMGQGVDDIQQIGPGNILSGLVKAIKREVVSLYLEQNYEKQKVTTDEKEKKDINSTNPEINNQLRSEFKEHKISANVSNTSSEEDIAIIGLSGRYPMADNLHDFWENLKTGKDCVTEIPKDRWNNDRHFNADKYNTDTYYSKWGGFLEDIDKFDATFFNISPKEAELIDPQERLFIETVWHTIEDAGYKKDALSDLDVGVFVGVMFGQYQLFGAEEFMKGNFRFSETSYASIANRVSFFLNLHGPSIAIDTMCSSSLVAVHMACESIKRGECELAIAGGVNLSLHPIKYYLLSQKRFASSDGRCRAFGEGGDGYVPGEGVGAVLIKPLRKAVQDRDNIYAVIKGSAINHGGKTSGYTVPNPIAQSDVISKALKKANINPRTISYVEAHGTGTALGDPIEINGLNLAYNHYTNDKQYCSIGSVKTNIGHLESAAGIASLTKVLLQMKNKQLVNSIHSDELNSLINFEDTPFYVQHKLENWKRPVIEEDGIEKIFPRRAGISAFGAGGTNVHIILEEYENDRENREVQDSCNYVFILSARKQHILEEYAKEFVNFLDNQLSMNLRPSISDIVYTLQTGRTEMEERIAFIASDIQEIREKLVMYIEGRARLEDFYQGNAMSKGRYLDSDIAAKQARNTVESRMSSKELNRLAQLWVLGVSVDWNLLYKENSPNRIPIPTYPFSKERYWIKQQKGMFQNVKDVLEQVKKILEQVEIIIEPNKSVSSLRQSDYITKTNNLTYQPEDIRNNEQNILHKLYNSPEYERNKIVVEYVQNITANFLSYIPPNMPEVYSHFFELGMDSVSILDFKSKIEKEFDVEFPSTILYEQSTIEKLSKYILEIIRLDSIKISSRMESYEEDKRFTENFKEDSSQDCRDNDKVLKLLDGIISSAEETRNYEHTEDDLKSIISKMGIEF